MPCKDEGIHHFLHYNPRDEYWHCGIGACSFKVHSEDLERAGYSHNADHTLYISEADFHDRLDAAHMDEGED